MLARNTAADRAKALGYIEQAVAVLEDHTTDDQDDQNVRPREHCCVLAEHVSASQIYPMDERQWLLGTAYNTGIECLQ